MNLECFNVFGKKYFLDHSIKRAWWRPLRQRGGWEECEYKHVNSMLLTLRQMAKPE